MAGGASEARQGRIASTKREDAMNLDPVEVAAGIHKELRQTNVHLGQISTNLASILTVLKALSDKLPKVVGY